MRVAKADIFFLNQVLKNLVRARKAQVSRIHCQNRKNIVRLAQILAQHNFILSYGPTPEVDQDNKNTPETKTKTLTLVLHQKDVRIGMQLPFDRVDLLSTSSRYRSVSFKQLLSLRQKEPFSLYLLYTPYGLLSLFEAIGQKTGGILIARIGY